MTKPKEGIVYKDIDGNVVVEEFNSNGQAESRARALKSHGINAIKTITKIDWIESEAEYKKILEKTKAGVKGMRDKKDVFDRAIKTLDYDYKGYGIEWSKELGVWTAAKNGKVKYTAPNERELKEQIDDDKK